MNLTNNLHNAVGNGQDSSSSVQSFASVGARVISAELINKRAGKTFLFIGDVQFLHGISDGQHTGSILRCLSASRLGTDVIPIFTPRNGRHGHTNRSTFKDDHLASLNN